MNSPRPLALLVGVALALAPLAAVQAQCLNNILYPFAPVVPASNGSVTQIANDAFEEDYSQITGIYSGVTYEFYMGTEHYITVRVGTFDGPVLGQGQSPLQVTTTSDQDLFVHWNVDAACNTAQNPMVTTVQIIQNCTPPTFTTATVNDCANGQFSIVVDVTSTGDGPTVDIDYNSDGGVSGSLTGQGVGTHTVGPFTDGDVVDIVVHHASDPSCNVPALGLTNIPCPIVSCGPDYYNYCYQNNDTVYFVYQADNTDPLLLRFLSGQVFSGGGDLIAIYDGLGPDAPQLYFGIGLGGDLTGVQAVSTNPDHALCLAIYPDDVSSCEDGSTQVPWNYVVGCYNCTEPLADFSLTTDCSTQSFTITANIYDMGGAASLDIENTGGAPSITVTEPNSYVTGPYPVNTPVSVTIVNAASALCNISSGPLVNDFCGNQSCGPDNYTFCYGDNFDTLMVYQGTSNYPIAIQFNAGEVEACCDEFTIFDGPDDTYPILYQGNNDGDMTGVVVVSTNPAHALTVVFSTDGSVNCQEDAFTPIDYTVACLDCIAPTVVYDVSLDCDNDQFFAEVNISDLGTDAVLDVTNDGGAPAQQVTAPGTILVGPFADGAEVHVTVVNDANPLCNVRSGLLTNDPCPVISCGPDNYTYCYPNSWDSTIVYQSASTEPIAIRFNSGRMEVCCDRITVYDGPNTLSPQMYTGNGTGGVLNDLMFISTNPDHALTIVFHSDGSVNCSSQNWPQLDWTVGCYDCTPPEVTYDVSLDCANDQFYVEVNITSLGSDPAMDITNDGGAPPILASAPGVYLSGPFADGASVQVSVENDANLLCNSRSPVLTNFPCPVVSCGPDNYIYCYPNNWDSTVVYQSANTFPIAVIFNSGRMETCCDRITVYDGLNTLATQIYQGNGTGGDLSELLFVSTNPDNALTIVFHSDGSVNCGSQGWPPLNWTVSCLDCTNPAADFEVVPDCIHHTFSVAVNVTNTGSSNTVRLANSYAPADTLENIGLGTTLVGPIPMDSVAKITVLNALNPLCRIFSEEFTYDVANCYIPSCDATTYEYCYSNLDTAYFTYVSSESVPITINFLWGQLLVNDFLQVFDGFDATAPLLYMGNEGGDMSGFAVNSENVDNALTLRVVTSSAGSCSTGQAHTPLHWVIGCGQVGIEDVVTQGDLSLFPNPTSGELNIRLPEGTRGLVDMRVVDVSGRTVRHETFNAGLNRLNVVDLSGVQMGNYTVVLTTSDRVFARKLQLVR